MPTEIELPVGRIVWGHPAKSQVKKDQQTRQPVMKDGKPVEQWVFGVAYPKADFINKIWPAMAAEIATGYPQGTPPNFSFKYKDGDGVDSQGKPFATREGYPGHYVMTVSTEAFAPPIYRHDGRQYVQMQANEIKCGDFIVLKANFKVNVPTNRAHTPGLFINPVGILFVAYGTEIQTQGGDPTEMFGAAPQQYQLPPGASMTPLAPNPGAAMPGQPMQQPGFTPPGGYAAPGMPASYGPAGTPGNGMPSPSNTGPGVPPNAYPSNQMQPPPGQPMQQPVYQPQPGMPGQPQYQPAHDFVQNAGYQQPGQPQYQPQPQMQPPPGQPMQQPQYQPQPGMMPPNR